MIQLPVEEQEISTQRPIDIWKEYKNIAWEDAFLGPKICSILGICLPGNEGSAVAKNGPYIWYRTHLPPDSYANHENVVMLVVWKQSLQINIQYFL